mgnify:CR=1 FL=1
MNEITVIELPEALQTPEARREFILQLEDKIQTETPVEAQVTSDDCPLIHSFGGGMYVREIFIPAGILLTGKIHKHEHPNFLMEGKVSMITEDGGARVMEGPQSLMSPAGCKRALFTHTPTWWITVHLNPNGHTEFTPEYEDELIAKDYAELAMSKIEVLEEPK